MYPFYCLFFVFIEIYTPSSAFILSFTLIFFYNTIIYKEISFLFFLFRGFGGNQNVIGVFEINNFFERTTANNRKCVLIVRRCDLFVDRHQFQTVSDNQTQYCNDASALKSFFARNEKLSRPRGFLFGAQRVPIMRCVCVLYAYIHIVD